jgi:hypothetical protein
VLKKKFGHKRDEVEYLRVGTEVTLAPQPFSIFCAVSMQQPHASNKVQYLADGDVSKVTCFQEIMTQVPKS